MFINKYICMYYIIQIIYIYFKPMNLNAVLDCLEELDNTDASTTLCPPVVDELTDEDSADEEGDVPIVQHNLNRNHLLA